MRRIGLFGGSFNPPHLGHLHIAEVLHDALALDEVFLIPAKKDFSSLVGSPSVYFRMMSMA